MRRGRQIVGDVVEALIADESVLFGMMTIRDYDVYTFQHSVNVCITASALGIRLGLDRLTARELGVAALFHDVGKVKIPRKILNKPGRFTPQEWEIMKSHPVLGARTLLRNRGLEPGTIRAVQVALEHHIRFDGSGYPQLYVPQMPSLYSRIVTICDCYDAMTSVRAYRQIPITPAVAMAYIWQHRDQGFDPALVKAFIGMLGAYPPGTLVRLSDETLAVVVEGPRTPDVFRPVVRRWGAKEALDLAKGKLEVQRCLDPAGLNLSDAELRAHLTLPSA
jgi:putative nucleotidyltransferase with HDIG domain